MTTRIPRSHTTPWSQLVSPVSGAVEAKAVSILAGNLCFWRGSLQAVVGSGGAASVFSRGSLSFETASDQRLECHWPLAAPGGLDRPHQVPPNPTAPPPTAHSTARHWLLLQSSGRFGSITSSCSQAVRAATVCAVCCAQHCLAGSCGRWPRGPAIRPDKPDHQRRAIGRFMPCHCYY